MTRVGELGEAATRWMDRAWDDGAGLLWNPPGAFDQVVEPRTVHLVRETAWYALALLRRGDAGDADRAARAVAAVLDHQYDEPGQPWHGTFVRFPEWPAPAPGAVEWVDYDPNWRQFVGTALAVVVTDFDLPPGLADRARAGIDLATVGEPPDRVPATYANIALLRAWLDAWAGRPFETYAESIAATFHQHGCFIEHGSPTYYGIDVLALGLWQRADAPPLLQERGAELEAALWTDVARWWHADLGNLCGPYSRAYGMDLHNYVGGLALALRTAGVAAPLPDLEADVLPHGHDLCEAPLLEHLGVRVPQGARAALERFPGPHAVAQVISDAPRREASGWLDADLMVGAEHGDAGLHARGQFHPATVHWRQPDGTVGWLRVEHHGPTRARAAERRLEVECLPHERHGDRPVTWVTNAVVLEADAARWRLPGLDVEVATDAPLTDPATLTYAPAGPTTFTLHLTPT